MGLANLVPGVSGGTMILAMGLYERFIDALADVTRLRFNRKSIRFLILIGLGAGAAIVGLSGPAVGLVSEYRWLMYSLFIGMTLGGTPELLKACKPFNLSAIIGFVAAFSFMAALAWGLSEAQIPENSLVFAGMGALAASSMILPGISGSYMLLIFGMYGTVIGSASVSALLDNPVECLKVLAPVGVGAVLGIALLSNLLKYLLSKHSVPSHAVLLGLLVGSVLGLWPFRTPVNPEMAQKPFRKSVDMLLKGSELSSVNEKYGLEISEGQASELRATYSGKGSGDLKRIGDELKPFDPNGGEIGISISLLVIGFGLTRLLGRKKLSAAPS